MEVGIKVRLDGKKGYPMANESDWVEIEGEKFQRIINLGSVALVVPVLGGGFFPIEVWMCLN